MPDLREDYITRFNRAREQRERWLGHLAPVASPRWGFSVFGMAAISGAMAFFGSGNALVAVTSDKFFCAILVAYASGLSASSARDWRRTLAAMLAFAWLFIICVWATTGSHELLRNETLWDFEMALGVAFVPTALVCAGHRRRKTEEASECNAAEAAIVEVGSSVIFPVFGAAAFLLVWWSGGFVPLWPALVFVASPFAAVLVYPATAAVVEALLHRRVPIDRRYKLK